MQRELAVAEHFCPSDFSSVQPAGEHDLDPGDLRFLRRIHSSLGSPAEGQSFFNLLYNLISNNRCI